ncbi:MAG: hypothetical protein QNJ18_05790 [Xenococcaceae cyanobacterium MO_167.B52]|nr:hypothetical protein [Xenococcaceae cyanobacterium MO_167.B52]
MANIDTRWEQALLNKVISNGERIAVMERDIKEIKDNSLKTQEDISELKSDVSTLKSDVSILKSDVSNLDGRLSDTEKLIHDAKKLMKWILGGMGAVFLSLVANFIYAYLH